MKNPRIRQNTRSLNGEPPAMPVKGVTADLKRLRVSYPANFTWRKALVKK